MYNYRTLTGHYRDESGMLSAGNLDVVRESAGYCTQYGDQIKAASYRICGDLTGVVITAIGNAWEFLPDNGECERIGLAISDGDK